MLTIHSIGWLTSKPNNTISRQLHNTERAWKSLRIVGMQLCHDELWNSLVIAPQLRRWNISSSRSPQWGEQSPWYSPSRESFAGCSAGYTRKEVYWYLIECLPDISLSPLLMPWKLLLHALSATMISYITRIYQQCLHFLLYPTQLLHKWQYPQDCRIQWKEPIWSSENSSVGVPRRLSVRSLLLNECSFSLNLCRHL